MVLLIKTPPFNKVDYFLRKWLLHGGISKIFSLPYVLDLMDLLEPNFCRDSNSRVKLMYESVK